MSVISKGLEGRAGDSGGLTPSHLLFLHHPLAHDLIDCRLDETGSFRIQLADPDVYKREVTIQVVDETHGNAVRRWNLMGGPQFPTREQISELQRAAMVPTQETISLEDVINLEPQALALIEIFHV